MLDPVSSLAFEMQASKGIFALLVGSGISRAAKIPTGWEVTLDLAKKVAALRGEGDVQDVDGWYRKTFGKAPDYSDLLNTLASTPAQRQQIMAPYIEPTPQEREAGQKQPTAAHRAIAAMMSRGVIRVVITTNFDRLLELALADLGVQPTVVSSSDHLLGSIPLVHAGPMIIKIHGDYLDTRIRNTNDELSAYEPAMDRFLDRVFDEFGLVICGWSGEWDVALKAAIDRAPSRRYPTYWASRTPPGAAGQALVSRRAGRLVTISDADSFFDELDQKVQALERLSQPHPLSADVAVAMMKEYLPEPRHAIRIHDLIAAEMNKVMRALESPQFSVASAGAEVFAGQVEAYGTVLDTLMKMACVAGRWSNEEQTRQWVDIVTEFSGRAKGISGSTLLLDLMSYPGTLILYAFGIGAVAGRRPENLRAMAARVVDTGRGRKCRLTDRLNIAALITSGQDRFRAIAAYANKRLAGSELIADVLRPVVQGLLPREHAFEDALARLELSFALGFAERESGAEGQFWAPPGRFVFQQELRNGIIETWKKEVEIKGQDSEICVLADLVGKPRFDEVQALAAHIAW